MVDWRLEERQAFKGSGFDIVWGTFEPVNGYEKRSGREGVW